MRRCKVAVADSQSNDETEIKPIEEGPSFDLAKYERFQGERAEQAQLSKLVRESSMPPVYRFIMFKTSGTDHEMSPLNPRLLRVGTVCHSCHYHV